MTIIPFPESLTLRQRQLKELYAATENILRLGEQGDWKHALAEQRERRKKMEDFFDEPTTPEDSPLVKEVIEAILDIDRQVAGMLYRQRNQMMDDMGKVRKNSRHLNDYVSNS